MGGDNGCQEKSLLKRTKVKIQKMWRNPKVRVWSLLFILNAGAIFCGAKKESEFDTDKDGRVYSFFEIVFGIALDWLVIHNLSKKPTDDPEGSWWMKSRCRRCCPCCGWCSFYNIGISAVVLLLNIGIVFFNAEVESSHNSEHKMTRIFFSFMELLFMLILDGLAVLPVYMKSKGDTSREEVALSVI